MGKKTLKLSAIAALATAGVLGFGGVAHADTPATDIEQGGTASTVYVSFDAPLIEPGDTQSSSQAGPSYTIAALPTGVTVTHAVLEYMTQEPDGTLTVDWTQGTGRHSLVDPLPTVNPDGSLTFTQTPSNSSGFATFRSYRLVLDLAAADDAQLGAASLAATQTFTNADGVQVRTNNGTLDINVLEVADVPLLAPAGILAGVVALGAAGSIALKRRRENAAA